MTISLVRYFHPEHGTRVGVARGDTVYDAGGAFGTVTDWLQASVQRVGAAVAELERLAESATLRFDVQEFDQPPAADAPHWLAPVDGQDVWASGVTYIRSRAARQEEAVDGGDIYARVYVAERPELFFKAHGRQVVGHKGGVGIRRDATWSVPEPELAMVMNPALEIVGFTVGNDMSSRDIEGENALYLPQAKMYRKACALGKGITLMPTDTIPEAGIEISIERGGQVVFQDSTTTQNLKRTARELIEYLGRSLDYPYGVVLMTGTGIVPPSDFTLNAGDTVRIAIEGVGELSNTVEVV